MHRISLFLLLLGFSALCAGEDLRAKAQAAQEQGNWKDAHDLWRKICLDPQADPQEVGNALQQAVQSLQQLNRTAEIDELLETTVQVHQGNWQLLHAAARVFESCDHSGFLIAGKFERGPHRGGGQWANCFERDRVRALQLMIQAVEKAKTEKNPSVAANLHFALAQMLARQGQEAWRLQYLTDLGTLPDVDEGGYGWYSGSAQGAPVDEAGNPVFHRIPKSFAEAQSDGERWRWCLLQAMELDKNLAGSVNFTLAEFLNGQFGPATVAYYGDFFRGGADEDGQDQAGIFAMHTLADDETIARLASGVKRFQLPAEFDFLKRFRELAEVEASGYAPQSAEILAQLFENRRQYAKAAEWWERTAKFGGHYAEQAKQHLDQIRKPWGEFEPTMVRPAGKGAALSFRFRNGQAVRFTAFPVKTEKLLADIKAYIESDPKELDWQKADPNQIGQRLVFGNETQYLGEKTAEWDLELKPRPSHFDRRIEVATPLQKAGAYLLIAEMKDGNASRILVWLDDMVIVKKPLDQGALYYVADAVTGAPIAKANLEFFGWRHEWSEWRNRHLAVTKNFAEKTDEDGLFLQRMEKRPENFQWITIARTATGRLAFLGFDHVWFPRYHDSTYQEQKFYFISDRPVYRPKQTVKFKVWGSQAQYDREGKSPFAGQQIRAEIWNPKGEKAFEKTFTADDFGGFDGEMALPADATLGVYVLNLPNHRGHVGTFRIEEYKKPEFEVKIEAPADPIMLGEVVSAQVKAKYLFGAPVAEAKVKYKVLRNPHDARWYPALRWDWFYGSGYWWFGYEYDWYPGWNSWGCLRPHFWWWPQRSQPPEIVAEGEAAIGKDGTFEVKIDTALAKAVHPDLDHRYEITAEVTDNSRRTIVGTGQVLVARKPFSVHAWVDRGYFHVGDDILAQFQAQTLDRKPVQGKGTLKLFKVSYAKPDEPAETEVGSWPLAPDAEGSARQQIKASEAGQYRLSYKVTDAKGREIEGAYLFVVRGQGFDGKNYRFDHLELVPDKTEFAPGEKVKLALNTDRPDGTVLLFVRPANGVVLQPKVLRLSGKSVLEEIEVAKKDMPNFFIEALTVADGKVHTEMREIVVPPEKRMVNVEVIPEGGKAGEAGEASRYKPGEKARVRLKLTDFTGKPFTGSTVITVYDKAVEYISGGSNVPEIKEFFWKWRRRHNPSTSSSLDRYFAHLAKKDEISMQNLGLFGGVDADEETTEGREFDGVGAGYRPKNGSRGSEMKAARAMAREEGAMPEAAAPAAMALADAAGSVAEAVAGEPAPGEPAVAGNAAVQPTVRTNFADTALWVAKLDTDADGTAVTDLPMPESLTTWKIRAWAMGDGTRCGEGSCEVITSKNLLLRLQAPRFFVEKDEVVLSANIHNYLKTDKKVNAVLEVDAIDEQGGKKPAPADANGPPQIVTVPAGGETRVDWRYRVASVGELVVRMKAITDEESDAMEMRFPAYVHGMDKMVPACGVIRPEKDSARIELEVPKERRINDSRLEVRFSPTLAMAMVDALPYLADYPYGCTEQTLNRFLPTVITQKVLQRMGVKLADLRDKKTNLNAQELGDPQKRAEQWKRFDANPVYDEEKIRDMVKAGVERLTAMQCSDGGWGWFSGRGETSSPHTTAVVVHGLQIARENDVAILPGVLERGIEWLKRAEAREIEALRNGEKDPQNEKRHEIWKRKADAQDAFVHRVLADGKAADKAMANFLFRDKNDLPVYAKATLGLALHRQGRKEEVAALMKNLAQFVVQDEENQTAYLNLGNEGYWWCWYGDETEAHAIYLKLLAATDPQNETASRLVKYLLNNRKHATYWRSTRDTALCVEAFADYIKATGEDKPDLAVEVLLDGKKHKEVRIDGTNLFTCDNTLLLLGDAVETGKHTVELRKKGTGPLYFNAYLSYFTLEDFIPKAGLEVKVERKVFRLKEVEKKIAVAGSRGQAAEQKVEKFEREELKSEALLKSGELVEVELTIEAKNDYEYLIFEDRKAAGFEPVEVRSGYNGNAMGAYVEYRDERVSFFVRQLARGRHSLAYRLRAEIPGRFSALPAHGYAMYAPELRGNSDEIKLRVE